MRTSLPNNQAVSYSYDSFGRRSTRTADGITTSFLYEGPDVVLDRSGDSSSVDYINDAGVDEKLRQTGSGIPFNGPLYFVQDHLRSTVALSDTAGGVVERFLREPFGDSAGSALTRYGFTGRERDSATRLIYFRARWYDSQQGRFTSEDSIGLGGGLNFYAYVENDPVTFIGPFKLAKFYFFRPTRQGQNKLGHAVLELDDGTWISYFPNAGVGTCDCFESFGATTHQKADDLALYDIKRATIHEIKNLDEWSIRKWWDQVTPNLPKWKFGHNCADAVLEALVQGGCPSIQHRIGSGRAPKVC